MGAPGMWCLTRWPPVEEGVGEDSKHTVADQNENKHKKF